MPALLPCAPTVQVPKTPKSLLTSVWEGRLQSQGVEEAGGHVPLALQAVCVILEGPEWV